MTKHDTHVARGWGDGCIIIHHKINYGYMMDMVYRMLKTCRPLHSSAIKYKCTCQANSLSRGVQMMDNYSHHKTAGTTSPSQ